MTPWCNHPWSICSSSSGWVQMCPASQWQTEWREALNHSCAALLSFLIAFQECNLQRSSLALLVGEVFYHYNYLWRFNEFKLNVVVLLQFPLKDRWRRYAATWHSPPMCSSSSRSTERLLLHCWRGMWWKHWGKGKIFDLILTVLRLFLF